MLGIIKNISPEKIEDLLKNSTIFEKECDTIFGEKVLLSITASKIERENENISDTILNIIGKYDGHINFTAKWSVHGQKFDEIIYNREPVEIEQESKIDVQTILSTLNPTTVLKTIYFVRHNNAMQITDELEYGCDDEYCGKLYQDMWLPEYVSEYAKLYVINEDFNYTFCGYLNCAFQKTIHKDEILKYLSRYYSKEMLLKDMNILGEIRYNMSFDDRISDETKDILRELNMRYFGCAISDYEISDIIEIITLTLLVGYIYYELYGEKIQKYFEMMDSTPELFEHYSTSNVPMGSCTYKEFMVKFASGQYIFANIIDGYDDGNDFEQYEKIRDCGKVKEVDDEDYD